MFKNDKLKWMWYLHCSGIYLKELRKTTKKKIACLKQRYEFKTFLMMKEYKSPNNFSTVQAVANLLLHSAPHTIIP
jgi:hypothetical protein